MTAGGLTYPPFCKALSMRVRIPSRESSLTYHANVLDGHLANEVLLVGIVLGSEAQLCEGGAGSNRSYGAGKRACRGESAGEHLEGCQWVVEKQSDTERTL